MSLPSAAAELLLSVIVPTYNRCAVLANCLRALQSQTAPLDCFEVIVSDDGSADATAETVNRFAQADGPRIRFLHQPNAGANAARNRAIAAARGKILLLINDDTIATPGMLASHLAGHALHPPDIVAVLGRVTVSPHLPSSRLAPLHLDRAYAGLDGVRELDWRAFFTCNVSVKKALLLRAGVFEERIRYHEDLELGQRLSRYGLRVIYRPDALGYHEHFLTEQEFFAIADREARALVVWSRIAPQLTPVLATLGFEPALPLHRRLKHRLVEMLVNRATAGFWRWIARNCPRSLDAVYLRIYDVAYQCAKRAALRRELQSQ
jgi:glycosyltransferase involved in cell wall biosynthesis